MPRLDVLLVERGLAKSRSQAQRWIADGKVAVRSDDHSGDHREGDGWQVVRKAGAKVADDVEVQIYSSEEDRYVSRAGAKLAAALPYLQTDSHQGDLQGDLQGAQVLDIGQSTGGFTDCVLQAGAASVVGVEVGHGQLAESLRHDARVVCLEGINARHLSRADLEPHFPAAGFDLVVMDVSFISQRKILPRLPVLMAVGGHLITLVKPQFECGPQALDKHGVVRDPQLFAALEAQLCAQIEQLGLQLLQYLESPILGGDGNREFLLVAKKNSQISIA